MANTRTSAANHLDTEAWKHIEALRALLPHVSASETLAMSAALSRLHVVYGSRAATAAHKPSFCTSCLAQLRAQTRRCVAPVVGWLAGTPLPAKAAALGVVIYRRYCQAERRLIAWRAHNPSAARYALDVPLGLGTAVLFYGDVISDIFIASELSDARQRGWTAACVLFILLPCIMAYASTAAYLLRLGGASSCALWLWLAVGLPWGVLGLDLTMFVDMCTLLREMPDYALVKQLKLLMPSYRATRVLWELCLETLPMSLLQLHIYHATRRMRSDAADDAASQQQAGGGGGGGATTNGTVAAADEAAEADLGAIAPVVALSLTLSLLNLVQKGTLLLLEAKAVGVGVPAHLWQQLQLGRGLPLHALRAHRIDAWQSQSHGGLVLRGDEMAELCAALRVNRSLRLLACCRAGVDCAGGVALARVLTVNRTLTSLDLGHNSLGGGSLEWAHALSDALRANTTLLSLGLSGNRVGVRACCVLAEGVGANGGLYSLDLSDNCVLGIDGMGLGTYCADGALALSAALEANGTLQYLRLEGNHLGAAPPSLRHALARNADRLRASFSHATAAAAAVAAAAAAAAQQQQLQLAPPLSPPAAEPSVAGAGSEEVEETMAAPASTPPHGGRTARAATRRLQIEPVVEEEAAAIPATDTAPPPEQSPGRVRAVLTELRQLPSPARREYRQVAGDQHGDDAGASSAPKSAAEQRV